MQTRKLKKRVSKTVTKKIVPRTPPTCSVCGRKIRVRSDGTITGGYYFGEIPLHRKSELEKMRRSGTRKSKIGPIEIDVYKYGPKPYAQLPY
jgi:hypothetical protein